MNADEADFPSLSASQASVRNPNAGLIVALREQLSDVRANRSDYVCEPLTSRCAVAVVMPQFKQPIG